MIVWQDVIVNILHCFALILGDKSDIWGRQKGQSDLTNQTFGVS